MNSIDRATSGRFYTSSSSRTSWRRWLRLWVHVMTPTVELRFATVGQRKQSSQLAAFMALAKTHPSYSGINHQCDRVSTAKNAITLKKYTTIFSVLPISSIVTNNSDIWSIKFRKIKNSMSSLPSNIQFLHYKACYNQMNHLIKNILCLVLLIFCLFFVKRLSGWISHHPLLPSSLL